MHYVEMYRVVDLWVVARREETKKIKKKQKTFHTLIIIVFLS